MKVNVHFPFSTSETYTEPTVMQLRNGVLLNFNYSFFKNPQEFNRRRRSLFVVGPRSCASPFPRVLVVKQPCFRFSYFTTGKQVSKL